MKPLSTIAYLKNNAKKVLPGFICMALGIFIIYFFSIILYSSIFQINRGSLNIFEKVTSVRSNTKDPMPDKILNKIEEASNVEYIIPIINNIGSFRYKSPFGDISTEGFNVFEEDIPKILKAFDIKLVEGKLPSANSNELLIPLKIAKQNKIKIGDYLSKDPDSNVILNKRYKVCGIIDGTVDTMITTNAGYAKREEVLKQSLMFSLKNKNDKMINDELTAMKESKVTIIDYRSAYDELNELFKIMNSLKFILNFIVISVLCISLGNLNHILFSNRKDEFAILIAIGYKKTTIYKRILKENITLNLLAFIFGVAFTIIAVELLNIVVFKPNGQYVYSFHVGSIFTAFLVPLFVSISNMIPPLRNLKAMDYKYLNI
ncbi:ABC transporter permease [Clostridium aciditolerans]|uniref:ABC transporter permease n=1 Tax=Clostridium aciditolerans TaxID=339861 RepID=A0A934HW13_9CLOT|nr:ABC transporter permease [Clostridium aciditolerans]MBI6875330.1 ABC transporter permease [Clostridium aciditolerans]